MVIPLHVLIIDDRPEDAELLLFELRRAGFAVDWQRVDTEPDYLAHLRDDLDVILADYSMPQFSIPRALDLLHERDLDIPFIVVTGSVTEQMVIETLRRGVADYLLKDRLDRLGPAITRVVEERRLRDQKRQTEQALRESEARYRQMFEGNHAIKLVIDPVSSLIVDANPAACQFYGYSLETLKGMRISDINMAAEEQVHADIERVLSRQNNYFIFRHRLASGDIRDVEVDTGPIHVQGRPLLFSIIHDITERKQAEAALSRSEATEREQRILAEALRDTVAALAGTLDSHLVMDRVLENVGRVVSHDSAVIMLIEGDAVFPVYWRSVLSENEDDLKTARFPLDRPDLREMITTGAPLVITDMAAYSGWVDKSTRSRVAAPIRVHGQAIGFLTLDSTTPGFYTVVHAERLQIFADQAAIALENAQVYDNLWRYTNELDMAFKQAEQALRRKEATLSALINASLESVYLLDTHGTILAANETLAQRLGSRLEELLNANIYELLPLETAKTRKRYVEQVVASGGPVRFEDERSGRIFDNSIYPVFDEHGLVSQLAVFGSDITARKQVEQELREVNSLKTEFLSTAAHELRTPLTSIRGFSEILVTRVSSEERQKRYLTLINEQATQLGQLIDDLLDISRMEAKRSLALQLVPLHLFEIVQQAMMLFVELATKHQIRTEGWEACCPPLVGDSFRLAQVIKNLLSNAVKYSPNGGTITVRYRALADEVEISIQDQGLGLTSEQLAHLFEKFYRADVSNTAVGGTGLGLAISKLIIELHDGRIWAESDYGSGTTFFFTLPLKKEE